MKEKSKEIFGNKISEKVYKKAIKLKEKYLKKYGDDSNKEYKLYVEENGSLNEFLEIKNLVLNDTGEKIDKEKGIVIGNIRMGFGHYRISMAIASAAKSKGYIPYWFDLHSYEKSTGGKIIEHLNSLYSLGSRLSQKSKLFNKYYWEPLNSKGFKKLEYNAVDQKVSELMMPLCKDIPKEIPFIACHVWAAQAAVHAGIKKVINVIPDNWPMALHLAEGAVHTVQNPSSYFGYKSLRGMGKKELSPMGICDIKEVGHYVDHELLVDLEEDSRKRVDRLENGKALRLMLTVGGAGAQKDIFETIIKKMIPLVKSKKVVLYINVGDHIKVLQEMRKIEGLKELTKEYINNWDETKKISKDAIDNEINGIHLFYNKNIFEAVYGTNLLMRSSDLLITKPSELAFYPIPKLMIKRVGGHEAWGAIRAAEIGDGTFECEKTETALKMLDMLLEDGFTLKYMNECILKAKKAGIYDGAYKVIDLGTLK